QVPQLRLRLLKHVTRFLSHPVSRKEPPRGPQTRKETGRADELIHAGADGAHPPAGRQRGARGRALPAARDQRADVLPVEEAVRRSRHGRGAQATPAPRGESQAQAGRADLTLDKTILKEALGKKW